MENEETNRASEETKPQIGGAGINPCATDFQKNLELENGVIICPPIEIGGKACGLLLWEESPGTVPHGQGSTQK